jgi:hypothetical protein
MDQVLKHGIVIQIMIILVIQMVNLLNVDGLQDMFLIVMMMSLTVVQMIQMNVVFVLEQDLNSIMNVMEHVQPILMVILFVTNLK